MTPSDVTLGLLLALGLVASWLDLRTHTLPDRLTLGALAAFLLLAGWQGHLVAAVLGAAIPAALLLLIALLAGGGLGGGDVKYLAAIGAALGPLGGFLALLAAALIGALQGVLTTRRGGGAYPFGPALAAGSILAQLLWPILMPILIGR